jgi:hypothetical protein
LALISWLTSVSSLAAPPSARALPAIVAMLPRSSVRNVPQAAGELADRVVAVDVDRAGQVALGRGRGDRVDPVDLVGELGGGLPLVLALVLELDALGLHLVGRGVDRAGGVAQRAA